MAITVTGERKKKFQPMGQVAAFKNEDITLVGRTMTYSSSSLSMWAVLIFVICCALRSGTAAASGHGLVEQREFDYFKLALQWPPTYCRRSKHCCSSNACCRRENAPTGFTIHGLWPDYNDGTWPACCTRSTFNQKEVETLLDALNTYWPSLSCGTTSTCFGGKGPFWAHEWGKHGTCSAPVVHDEYNYFLTALNVYFKHNVTEVLHEAGYVPSNSEKYPAGGIISAIQNAFHATPQLLCSSGALQELYLCFYKDFKPRDCAVGTNVNSRSSCPEYVSLPAYASLGLQGTQDGRVVETPSSAAM